MNKIAVYLPNGSDWMPVVAELLKLGKTATDSKHLVAVSTESDAGSVQGVLMSLGIHYFLVDLTDTMRMSFSGDGGLSTVYDLINSLPKDPLVEGIERQAELRKEMDEILANRSAQK